MSEQEFATVHIDGVSLLRVVLEAMVTNTDTVLGFRIMVENRRTGSELFLRSVLCEGRTPSDIIRAYNEGYRLSHLLAGTLECDHLDRAIIYTPLEG